MENKSDHKSYKDINKIKEDLLLIIDEYKDEIINIGRDIYKNPELGYKEIYATNFSYKYFKETLNLKSEKNIAITGAKAIIQGKEKGINIDGIEHLLFKRADIVKKAEKKVEYAERLLLDKFKEGQRWLV